MGFKVVIRDAPNQASPLVLADSPFNVGAHNITWNGQRLIETSPLCQSDFQGIFNRKNRVRRFGFDTWRVFASEAALGGWFLNHDDEVPCQGTVIVQIGNTTRTPGATGSYELAGAQMVNIYRIFGVAAFCRYELILGRKLGGIVL